jgi:hypothetical protein
MLMYVNNFWGQFFLLKCRLLVQLSGRFGLSEMVYKISKKCPNFFEYKRIVRKFSLSFSVEEANLANEETFLILTPMKVMGRTTKTRREFFVRLMPLVVLQIEMNFV